MHCPGGEGTLVSAVLDARAVALPAYLPIDRSWALAPVSPGGINHGLILLTDKLVVLLLAFVEASPRRADRTRGHQGWLPELDQAPEGYEVEPYPNQNCRASPDRCGSRPAGLDPSPRWAAPGRCCPADLYSVVYPEQSSGFDPDPPLRSAADEPPRAIQ